MTTSISITRALRLADAAITTPIVLAAKSGCECGPECSCVDCSCGCGD